MNRIYSILLLAIAAVSPLSVMGTSCPAGWDYAYYASTAEQTYLGIVVEVESIVEHRFGSIYETYQKLTVDPLVQWKGDVSSPKVVYYMDVNLIAGFPIFQVGDFFLFQTIPRRPNSPEAPYHFPEVVEEIHLCTGTYWGHFFTEFLLEGGVDPASGDVLGEFGEATFGGIRVAPFMEYSTWFGLFFDEREDWEGWISHMNLGWLYIAHVSSDGGWMFSPQLGWIYTNEMLYPHVYSMDEDWLYVETTTRAYLFIKYYSYSQELWDYLSTDFLKYVPPGQKPSSDLPQ